MGGNEESKRQYEPRRCVYSSRQAGKGCSGRCLCMLRTMRSIREGNRILGVLYLARGKTSRSVYTYGPRVSSARGLTADARGGIVSKSGGRDGGSLSLR